MKKLYKLDQLDKLYLKILITTFLFLFPFVIFMITLMCVDIENELLYTSIVFFFTAVTNFCINLIFHKKKLKNINVDTLLKNFKKFGIYFACYVFNGSIVLASITMLISVLSKNT